MVRPVDRIINTKLLMHPVNWLIVWTVLLFAGFAWALAHEYFGPVTTTLPE
jgi:hypothetical protein